MKRLFIIFLAAMTASLYSDDQRVTNADLLLWRILLGQCNPASYHEFLLRNSDRVLPLMKNDPFRFDPAHLSSLNTDHVYASLNLDWGNYNEAIFFAKRELKTDKGSLGALEILCAARYSSGDRGVIAELKPNYPNIDKLEMYGEFEKYIKPNVPLLEKQKWLLKQCSLGGSLAYSFLNAFLSHPDYAPSRKELDAVVNTIASFLKFWSGLKVEEFDEGGKIERPPAEQYIFDTTRGYCAMSLISLDLTAQYRRLGLEKEAKAWQTRSEKAYRAARQVNELTPAWENKYRLTAEKLGIKELASLATERSKSQSK